MGIHTFRGGIHPYDGKERSKEKPIKTALPKGELVYLLSQHIGAPAIAMVKEGDYVLAGQKIAKENGFVSVPIHASVSGTVKAIEPCMSVMGSTEDAIVVENDGKYESVPYQPLETLEGVTQEEIRRRIKEGGIVGMGGAGFPTHVKLSPKEPDTIEYVIVNGAECEPYLTSDYRRMLEEPEKVIGGLKIVLRLFDHARGYIAIEDNKPDCIGRFQELLEHEEKMEVRVLKTKYPQGAERQLIYAITNRQIHSSMLPADAGCVVNNVDTMVAIYHAVKEGRPLIQRVVTVTGDAIKEPQNLLVCTGTKYEELVEQAGGFQISPEKLIAGGPMMGIAIYDLKVPVTKTSSALLCLTKDEVSAMEPTNCINCGRCVLDCPARLIPARLAWYAQHYEEQKFLEYNGMECCECGCCSYVCPAKRPLAQAIKSMRRLVLAERKKS